MIVRRQTVSAGTVLTFLVLLAAPLAAQDASVCRITGMTGSVKVLTSRDRAGKANVNDVSTWADARLNMPLREKDMVATLSESEVRLELAGGSAVRLREKTTVEVASLKSLGAGANVKLTLADGSVIANVKRVAGAGGSTFEIETPTALAAIRGTTVELDSRKSAGNTTLKTFDGSVQVAPAGTRNFADVGNYRMTEVGSGERAANVREVPSFYRPKTTKLLSEYNPAELTGFTRVILTYDELEEIGRQFESDGIPAGIGIGESMDEMAARRISSDNARAQLAANMSTQVQRISESYSQDVGGKAKSIWEEGIRQITNVSVRGSTVHTTITQQHKTDKRYKVYSLMIIDPSRLKAAFATPDFEEETALRVRKDDMMSRLDASVKALNTKYHDR